MLYIKIIRLNFSIHEVSLFLNEWLTNVQQNGFRCLSNGDA